MILVDYNAIAIGNIVMQKDLVIEENLIRHMILNSLRMYNKKFRDEYGDMVVCCDASGNWRRDVYPQYKQNRKDFYQESKMDWDEIFRIINLVREEIKENMPWKVVQVWKCEGDDVIATLVETTQEFGNYEKVMIVSADRDFAQLQRYENVSQFSPMTKDYVKAENPRAMLFEHICRGDTGDGVPNVRAADDHLVNPNSGRQPPITAKKLQAWTSAAFLEGVMTDEEYRNYQRNKRMIDLTQTPDELKQEIINTYESQDKVPTSSVMPYLIKKRCKRLIENVGDFF